MLLDKMKTGVSKIVMVVLALLLILSFAIWGVGDMVGNLSTPREVANVGGSAIGTLEFREQYRRELSRLRQRIGEIEPEQARGLGLADATLNGLISNRLLARQARDLGLLVSDAQIIEQIHAQPAFRNALGQFDRTVFANVLANNGLSEGEYVASVRQEAQQGFIGGAIATGITAPAPLADAVFAYRNEKRSAEVIRVARGTLDTAAKPTDAELAAFYEKNGDAFMAPEFRTISLLYLNPDELAKEMTASPERIKEEYESRLSSLAVPERRKVEQILLTDEAEANKASALLNEGRAFAAVAKDVAGKSQEDIALGLVTESELLPDLGKAVFALAKDGVTKPVKSLLGWHIVRVVDITPGHKPTLEEARPQIVADLTREMALDDLVKRANKIEDVLAGGGALEEAATEVGAKLRKVGPMDAAKKERIGTPYAGLPNDGVFVETVFGTEKGKTSRLTDLNSGGFFLVRIDDVIASARRPLDEVRDSVVKSWQTEQLDVVAKKTADAVAEEAKAGKPFLKIAEERKLAVQTGKPVSRFATAGETVIPQALLADVFKAAKDGVVLGQTVEGYAVARVTEIAAAKPERESADYKRLVETIAGAYSNDLVQSYTRALRNEYTVTVNDAARDAVYTQ